MKAVEGYVEKRVDGIFLQAVKSVPEFERINHDVIDLLRASRIPVILLDAKYKTFPREAISTSLEYRQCERGRDATEYLTDHGT